MSRPKVMASAWGRAARVALPALCLALLTACTAPRQELGERIRPPAMTDTALLTADGLYLPLRRWGFDGLRQPKAVILALHGFADYRNAFAVPAPELAAAGFGVIAYDQRGFGAAPSAGAWPGADALTSDARAALGLVAARYPDRPLFLLGESMGGAVAILALETPALPQNFAGALLVSPALWSRDQMNPLERAGLWLARTIAPGLRLSGEGLDRQPTDNIDVLRRMARDPLVQKKIPIAMTAGLVDLMTAAYRTLPDHRVPTLALYGANEDIISDNAVQAFADTAPDSIAIRHYPGGYHMLLRDRGRAAVIADVIAWLAEKVQGTSGSGAQAKY